MQKDDEKATGTMSVIYVTRDIERALGIALTQNYRVLTNRTPYSESIKEQFPDFITLVNPEGGLHSMTTSSSMATDLLDTSQLLETDEMKKLMAALVSQIPDTADKSRPAILVFKNTVLIESICKKNGWQLLNPPAELAEKIENKITTIQWLGELSEKYLPVHIISTTKDIKWQKEPLVIQWAHGHTGDGTIIINSDEELSILKAKFPERVARATSFVNGPSFTLNIVVSREKILLGNISYQITGLPPLTDNPFSTIGNDWSLTHTLLSEKEISYIEDMAREIGEKMSKDGWCGMCGIDVIKDDERGQIYLIEINARQPASTTFESFLQEENRRNGVVGITIFEAYMRVLNREDKLDHVIHINDGAQLIKRITKDPYAISPEGSLPVVDDSTVGSLELAGYRVIQYSNTEHNSDLLRIQSMRGVMKAHGKFNTRGKEIVDTLSV